MKKDVVNETMRLLNENYFKSKLQETNMEQNTSHSVGDNLVKGTRYEDDWVVSHTVESADLFAGTPDIVLEMLSYLYGPEGDYEWNEKDVEPLENMVNKHKNECEYIAINFPGFNENKPTSYLYKLDEDGNVLEVLDSYVYVDEDTLNESKLQESLIGFENCVGDPNDYSEDTDFYLHTDANDRALDLTKSLVNYFKGCYEVAKKQMESDNNSIYQVLPEDVNTIKHLMKIFENAYIEFEKSMGLNESRQITEDLNGDKNNEINSKLRQADKNIDWLNNNGFKCGITYYQNMFPGDEGLTQEDYRIIYKALPNSKMQQGFSNMWEGVSDDWIINQQEYNTFMDLITSLNLSSYKQGMFTLVVSYLNNENRECYFIPEYNDINDSKVDIQKDDLFAKLLEG